MWYRIPYVVEHFSFACHESVEISLCKFVVKQLLSKWNLGCTAGGRRSRGVSLAVDEDPMWCGNPTAPSHPHKQQQQQQTASKKCPQKSPNPSFPPPSPPPPKPPPPSRPTPFPSHPLLFPFPLWVAAAGLGVGLRQLLGSLARSLRYFSARFPPAPVPSDLWSPASGGGRRSAGFHFISSPQTTPIQTSSSGMGRD